MTIDNRTHLVPWTLALGMFVVGTTSLSILGIGPALTRDLAMAPSAAGWLVAAFAATFAVAAPIVQFTVGRRASPHHLITGGTAVLAVALVWSALASEFYGLLLARTAAALGGALIAPTSAALAIASVPDDRRGASLAIVFAGFTLATVGGVPVVTWLTLWLGWRGAMAAIAAAAFVFLLLVLAILPRDPDEKKAHATVEAHGIERWRVTAILLGTLGMLGAQFTIYSLMGELLGQHFDVSEAGLPLAILLFGIFGIFGVAGNAVAGAMSDRIGAGVLVWMSIAGLAALLVAMNLGLGPYLGTLVLAGCAFAGTLFTAPQQTRLVGLVPKERHGFVLALNSSTSYLGIALGSALASAIATRHGLDVLPIVAAGMHEQTDTNDLQDQELAGL